MPPELSIGSRATLVRLNPVGTAAEMLLPEGATLCLVVDTVVEIAEAGIAAGLAGIGELRASDAPRQADCLGDTYGAWCQRWLS